MKSIHAPLPGKHIDIDLDCDIYKDTKFILGIYEGRRSSVIALEISAQRKSSFQMRTPSAPLMRIDYAFNKPHTNPDGEVIIGPHLHYPVEGYGLSYAISLSDQDLIPSIINCKTTSDSFDCFATFCGITERLPIIWPIGA